MPVKNFALDVIDTLAKTILKEKSSKYFCFYGDMGAGKTTLIKAMLKTLEAKDLGNSPTFGIVNEYHDTDGNLLAYHFDFYRLNNEEEAYDMGLEDYFDTDAHIFIEWPEHIPNLLPEDHNAIYLRFIDENTRSIEY
ncbi:tRNA (adenosine(37)-N6)-threonylcarbamoyltransferase complex ATPase subunit type 1 TsaE [uncultured Croceitalea sp.]|uniref:tRNA (adenosine(37)-N6)-threonylcarbamoyltransferase complex ATPase subunit type 1 TsaE n=1 Tax=uncultured Croceitalea sp. TaxID=1798908 RepID=UPI003305730E